MRIAALIVAAGQGTRATGAPPNTHVTIGADTAAAVPKQYAKLAGRAVLAHTIDRFAAHRDICAIQVVIGAHQQSAFAAAIDRPHHSLLTPVVGGANRQASVRAGLEALAASATPPDAVMIHDAARPFISGTTIAAVADKLKTTSAVLVATPLTDTLKQADANGLVEKTLDRANLWRAETPQAFHFNVILDAHRAAAAAGVAGLTDDAAVIEWTGQAVTLIAGLSGNDKITTSEDLAMANQRLSTEASLQPSAAIELYETRMGQGFDVHKFGSGDHIMLGGIPIPHSHGLVGHSDADVLLHAITDALLGAIGDGDIGQHFPPTDAKWKGAASDQFLADAAARVRARRGRITNVDATVMCETPKIGPHRDLLQNRIAEILDITPDRVSVKATTTEQLGFTGRKEGIATLAIATVMLPV